MMVARWLLGSVTALGLVAGLAFSASYQMVARFANKNTISLARFPRLHFARLGEKNSCVKG